MAQDIDFSRMLDELDEPETTGFGTPVAEPSQEALDAFDLPGSTRKLIDDVVSARESERRQSDYVEKGKEVVSALADPQQYKEFAKGIVPGAISMGGTAIQAPDAITAKGQQGAAKFGRKQLEIMDRIDRGEAVPEMEDPIGYQYMSQEQRLAARRDQERATAEFNPTPMAERPFFKAGEKVQKFAKDLMPAAPGYEESVGRQLGEGMGSMAFGLPLAYFGGPVVAGTAFGSAGIGEATQRAVEYDRKEKAAGRPGLTEDQIATAGILGVGPGATDLLPVEVLIGRLPVPLPPALRRPLAMAIGRIGGQAFIEGAQEGGQAFLQNLIAREVYNPEQPLVDGIEHEMGIGAGVGGIAQTAKELGVWMLKSGAIRRKKGIHDSLVEHEKAQEEAAQAAGPDDTRTLAPSQEGPTPRLEPGQSSVRGALPTEPAIQDAERLLSEINQGTIAQASDGRPLGAEPGATDAKSEVSPTETTVLPPAPNAPVPTFQDAFAALPKDSAGDPDIAAFMEATGGRPYNQLTDAEKIDLVRRFRGEAPTEAAGAVSQPEAATPAPQAQTPATAQRSLTEAIEEGTRQAVQEIADLRTEGTQTREAVNQITDETRARFAEVLSSKERRSNWGKAVGVSEEQVRALIDEAVADGRLTMRKGQPVRTAKARQAPPTPQAEVARAATSVPMGRAAEVRLERITNNVAYKHAAALLGAGLDRTAALKKLAADKKATRAVLDEIHRAVTGKPSKSLRSKQAVIDALAKAETGIPASEQNQPVIAQKETTGDVLSPVETSAPPADSYALRSLNSITDPVLKGHYEALTRAGTAVDGAVGAIASDRRLDDAERQQLAELYVGEPIAGQGDGTQDRIAAIERLQNRAKGEEKAALTALLGSLRAGKIPPLRLRQEQKAASLLESKAPLAQRAFGTTYWYNIVAGDASLGEFSVTIAPGGSRAYIESIHLPPHLKAYAGRGMLRELRSLFHAEFPDVTTFFGDRSTGARAKSGNPRQEVRWLMRGPDSVADDSIQAIREAAAQRGRDITSALLGGYVPEISPSNLRVRDDIVARLQEMAQRLPAGSELAIKQVMRSYLPTAGVVNMEGEVRDEVRWDGLKKILAVSLEYGPDVALRTFTHEEIHLLRQMGIISDKEWAILSGIAKRRPKKAEAIRILDTMLAEGKWDQASYDELKADAGKLTYRELYGIDTKYGSLGLKEDKLVEETVAWAAGDWARGREMAAPIERVLQKIRDFLEAIQNALNGLGFRSANDIFESIWAGELTRKMEEARERRFNAEANALDWMQGEGITAMAIRAFHGSPHKFERFDIGKIGTGEGAQAFGHGLYFAESEDVAVYYRGSVGYRDIVRQFKQEAPEDADVDEIESLIGTGTFSPPMDRVLAALKKDDWLGFDYPSQAISAAFTEKIDDWDPSPELKAAVAEFGHLYEVSIDAEPEQFIDIDKALSEQSDYVKKALRSEAVNNAIRDSFTIESYGDTYYVKTIGGSISARSREEAEEMLADFRATSTVDNALADFNGPNNLVRYGGDRAAMAAALREAGIKGIRYADANSRAIMDGDPGYEETGTRNIVVFDDSIVTITSRDGKPVEPADATPIMAAFAGEKAKTADLEALNAAKRMEAEGKTREAIWHETGWFRGVDGRWRFEIDDSKSKLRAFGPDMSMLGIELTHDPLFDAYPELTDVEFNRVPGPGGLFESGGIIPPAISIGKGVKNRRSVTLHESQHAIQDVEQFAEGGSPRGFTKAEVRAEQMRLRNEPDPNDWSMIDNRDPDDVKTIRHSLYRKLAGEVEARTVQKRMNLTADQREDRPPWLDYDVPEDQQIVRMPDGGGQRSMASIQSWLPTRWQNPETVAKNYRAIAQQKPSETIDGIEVRRTGASKNGGVNYHLFDNGEQIGELMIDAPRRLPMTRADEVDAIVQGYEKVESRQPIAGTITRIEIAEGRQGSGLGSRLLDIAEADLREAGAILHPGDTSMTQDFINLYAKRDPNLLRDAFERMGLEPNADPQLMLQRALRERESRGQPMFALGPTPPQSTPEGESPGLNKIISDLKKTLGMPVSQGLWGFSVQQGNRSARVRPPSNVRGQFDRETGNVSLRQSRDIKTLAHEGGHYLESILGTDLGAIKQAHAEALTGDPAPMPAALSEGFANWFRDYILDPDAAEARAPGMTESFEELLEAERPDMLEGFDTIQQEYQRYITSAPIGEVAAGLSSQYDGTTWRELSKDKAFDNVSGKLTSFYNGAIDSLHPAAKGLQYLLKTGDANGIRDEDGRPISIKVGDNFYKRLRLFAGSFNRGRVWLEKGVSDLETGRVIGPSLKAALEKALGAGKFNMEKYKSFNQYLVSIRAIAEYDRLDQKAATLKQYDDTLARIANARPTLAERIQRDQSTLDRRQDALTRANAMLADRRRMLGAAETRLETVQDRLDGVLADIAEAGEMDALAQDIADPLAENAVSENYGAMVARRRRQVQNLERQQREAIRAVERLSEEVSGRDVEAGMLQEEIRQLSEGVARGRQQIAQLDEMTARVRKEREAVNNRGASRPPTAEPRAVHERVIRELGTPEFQEAAQMVHDFTFSLLEARRQAGFISQELFDELAKRKDWYVPFFRDMSDIEGAGAMFPGSGVKKWSMFKKFDGSDRSIIMPMEILSEEAYSTAQQIAFNDAVKAMIGLAERVGPGGGKVAERLARAENMEANEETFGRIRQMAIDLGIDPLDAHMITQRMEMNFSDGDIRVIMSPENLGPTAKPQLPMWENGERIMVRLPDPAFGRDLFEAINGLGKEMSDILVKALALPAQALRIGVTTHPDFIFRNIWRDIWTAWKLTGAAPFVTQYRGFKLINEGGEVDGMSGEDFRRLYNEAGGIAGGINVNAQVADSRRDVKDLLDTNVSKKAVAAGAALGGFTGMAAGAPIGSMLGLIFGGPVGMGVGFKIGASIGGLVGGAGVGYAARHGEVFRAVESVETATRLGVAAHAFKRAKEHNPELSDLEAITEAAFVSRDIMDWNRRGSKMLAATRLVTFLNAQIQGLDKQYRQMGAYGDRGSALKKHLAIVFKHQNDDILSRDEQRDLADAYKAYVRWGAITLMLVMAYALYADDDDYQDIKDETKATHTWAKILGTWFRLPNPFELGIPAVWIGIIWDKLAGRDQRMAERLVDSAYEVLAPPAMPQVMRLTGGVLFNRDRQGIFSGRSREIVGENLASRPPHERWNAFTSEFAIDLSQAMYRAGVPQSLIPAPVKTDFVLSAAGAYWGREVQNSYQTAKTMVGMSTRPDRKATDFPILRGFTGEAARMSRGVNDMWSMISREGGEFTMAATEYKQLMDDRGRPVEAEMWLKSLDPEQRVWALTQYYGSRSEKREHPLERASQADRINREIMRDTISDTLAPKVRQGRRTVRDYDEKIELTPAKKTEVIDILARLSQVEARNTMILMKRPGFEGMDIKDPQLILDELKAASPPVHDLLMERRDKKVADWPDVVKEWPKYRDRVLKESVNAF